MLSQSLGNVMTIKCGEAAARTKSVAEATAAFITALGE